MKKIISMVLTVSMILSASSLAFAQPKEKAPKPASTTVTSDVETETVTTNKGQVKKTKATDKKVADLSKAKETLLKKCDVVIAQINKLKGYIISTDGKFLVEFKDKNVGDDAIESIEDAIDQVNDYKDRINDATTSKDLKAISKDLQNSWMKNQTFVKRITGITSAARLKIAYDKTKVVLDKLGAGINGITTDAAILLDQKALKAEYDVIAAKLEAAHDNYLEAVQLYSSIANSTKADKDFKTAHAKLMDAKDGIHDTLIDAKQLLVKIKTSVKVDNDTEEEVEEEDEEEDD